MTRLSCNRFRGNEVRVWLSILACSLGSLWPRPALLGGFEDWSLTSRQQTLVKTAGRLCTFRLEMQLWSCKSAPKNCDSVNQFWKRRFQLRLQNWKPKYRVGPRGARTEIPT